MVIRFEVLLDLGKPIPDIGEVLDSINESAKQFGADDDTKLVAWKSMGIMKLEFKDDAPQHIIAECEFELRKSLRKQFPGYEIKLKRLHEPATPL